MAPRTVIAQLQVDEPAKQMLDDMCKQKGMTRIAFMSRLVEWFATQDEIIQAWVLGLMGEQRLAELSRNQTDRPAAEPTGAPRRRNGR